MHIRLPGNNEKLQRNGDSQYIYQNELDKACFQHDRAFGDYKNFTIKTVSDKILCNEAFNVAKNHKNDEYRRDLSSMVYKFFNKKFASLTDKSPSGGAIKNDNKELAEQLYKRIIRKFEKRKVQSSLIDNVLGANLADIQL